MYIYKRKKQEERDIVILNRLRTFEPVLINTPDSSAGHCGGSEIKDSRTRLEEASDRASRQTFCSTELSRHGRFTVRCGVPEDRGHGSDAPERPAPRPKSGNHDGSQESSR